MDARDTAIVLLSGGLDSCVCLAEAVREFDVAALHLNYGQRTESRELRAFTEICDHYGVARRLVVDVGHLRAIGGSSLVDASVDVERGLPAGGGVPSTYVPFRNAHILCVAVSWGEVIGARALIIGAVEEDGSGYPDCTAAFYDAFQKAVDAGTRPDTRLEIRAPLLSLDKAGIAARGTELGAPLHLTWSCYTDEDEACGTCESCRLRLRGFARAGLTDPIPYRA
ncbi:MAG TPA: 7-cyano-7-deazaguanine synthase QueC [Candidatus Krumholzibacteria bacterium]|nr:7-cyano-7-deazaguanine synthase QueC [Candidatus Krumholzibacteria bacterium]HRX50228.1 7-cyano-7-deazaguanine synthase QueC [Candidatus Krumholzibacteria bacterium]